ALRDTLGLTLRPQTEEIITGWIATVRTRLGEPAFQTAWDAGAAATLDDLLADWESSEDASPSAGEPALPDPLSSFATLLTPRQIEVLRRLVLGMSDKEIGDELYISHRTVSQHVSAILDKLGVESRTAAAALAARQTISGTALVTA